MERKAYVLMNVLSFGRHKECEYEKGKEAYMCVLVRVRACACVCSFAYARYLCLCACVFLSIHMYGARMNLIRVCAQPASGGFASKSAAATKTKPPSVDPAILLRKSMEIYERDFEVIEGDNDFQELREYIVSVRAPGTSDLVCASSQSSRLGHHSKRESERVLFVLFDVLSPDEKLHLHLQERCSWQIVISVDSCPISR